MVANVIRYRGRSAVRDVGRALGVPATALDRLSRMLSYTSAPTPEQMRHAGLDPDAPVHRHLMRLSAEILDFPRHLSIHPGGFLLGHDPVHTIVPIENATMPGRTVIQWDKYDVEELGLFKVDLLALGALTLVDRCFALLREHEDVDLSLATIPPADDAAFDLMCRADTVGVFQIESRAQMAMLPRLRPRTFYDLVIEVSLVRPGPITGDMVHPYLRRRRGEEKVEYPHACLEPVLKKTLGVPLFQEQVMKLAMVAADYTPGEADRLRRDMAAWRREGSLEHHRDRLVTRMTARGIALEFAERVFQQIRGFGEYGFPESHAASFALITYATAWLRCHHRAAFTCALLNAQPMGFYSPASIIEDARRHGVLVLPACVNRSRWDCTMEPGLGGSRISPRTPDAPPNSPLYRPPLAVRTGLRFVAGLGTRERAQIENARASGTFSSIDDFIQRTGLHRGALRILAESGAFSVLDPERRSALWVVLDTAARAPLPIADVEPPPSFSPLTEFEEIAWDYRATGTSTRGHPLVPFRRYLDRMGLPDAETVQRTRDGRRVKYAGLVICRQRPGTAAGVVFMTLEDESGFVNLVVWPDIWERFAVIGRTASFLGVTGRIQAKEGVTHLIAEELWAPDVDTRPVTAGSRDFH
jgi:error-prone DNA polymerase